MNVFLQQNLGCSYFLLLVYGPSALTFFHVVGGKDIDVNTDINRICQGGNTVALRVSSISLNTV